MTKDEAKAMVEKSVGNINDRVATALMLAADVRQKTVRDVYTAIADATGTFHVAYDALPAESRTAIEAVIMGESLEYASMLVGLDAGLKALDEALKDVDA